MCDKKRAAQEFLKMAHGGKYQCMFGDMDEVSKRCGLCLKHNRTCSLPSGGVDCVIIGPPCQPFSHMRDKSSTLPHDHEDWNVIFGGFLRYLKAVLPAGGIVEEVPGFATPFFKEKSALEPTVPLQDFVAELKALNYHVQPLKLNNAVWMDVPRERFSTKHVCRSFEHAGFRHNMCSPHARRRKCHLDGQSGWCVQL